MSIHLRIHGLEDELPVYAEWVRKNTTTCLIVKETGERGHIHCLIETRAKLETFRKHMKIQFPQLEGNKSYSMKDVRSDLGIQDYLCKGECLDEMPFVYEKSSSWTEEKILQHHQSYWARHTQETLANTLAKTGNDSIIPAGKPGKIKVRSPTAVEKIAQKVRNQYTQEEIDTWTNNDVVRRKIIHVMMDYLGDVGRAFDMIVIKRMYYGVLHQIMPVESTHVWEDALVRLLDSDL